MGLCGNLVCQGRLMAPCQKNPKEGEIMINKLAIAMIVASMSALPMTFAHAQTATGTGAASGTTDGGAASQSGAKPTSPDGMPANCREGDAACAKNDPNNPAAGTMGTTGGTTSGTDGATGSQGMGNSSPSKDGSANSPNCKAGDTACDTNAPKK